MSATPTTSTTSTIRLQSSEGEIIETDPKALMCSRLITNMLVDCCIEPGSDTVVPLQNVNTATLRKFLQWANHHKDDPQPNDPKEKSYDISDWDENFLKIDQSSLVELIMAANYLDVKDLFEISCKTVASLITGKNADEIRETFNIENDFSRTAGKQLVKETKFMNTICDDK
ncbi:hypothetical protein HA402_003945 [Bradysia odoriphaga]|nr:hypothetical protein HA402_003945 [Bradysia odoriphaga]